MCKHRQTTFGPTGALPFLFALYCIHLINQTNTPLLTQVQNCPKFGKNEISVERVEVILTLFYV